MPSRIDLIGKKFHRLTVISLSRVDCYGKSTKSIWLCACECGKHTEASGGDLRLGKHKSCGCLLIDNARAIFSTHGKSGSRTYRAWKEMRKRCAYSNSKTFKDYGGRGIKVCARWNSFENFLADMGECAEGRELDRLDVNGDYEPSNCRWATRKEQMRNKRNTAWIVIDGNKKSLAEWCEIFGAAQRRTHARIFKHGWDPLHALTRAPMKRREWSNRKQARSA